MSKNLNLATIIADITDTGNQLKGKIESGKSAKALELRNQV